MNGDMSPLALMLRADPVVQGVVVLLLAASVGTWAVILEKSLRLAAARRQAAALLRRGGDARAPAGRGMAATILAAGQRAGAEEDPTEPRAHRRERIERAMRLELSEEVRRLEAGLPFLATVGSTAPFVGLFGTVWGIMHSFTAIAETENTSLAVVAPGIAEALFVTAIGLAVAIPSVVAYNRLTTSLSRTSRRIAGAIATLGEALSRQPPLRRAAE